MFFGVIESKRSDSWLFECHLEKKISEKSATIRAYVLEVAKCEPSGYLHFETILEFRVILKCFWNEKWLMFAIFFLQLTFKREPDVMEVKEVNCYQRTQKL